MQHAIVIAELEQTLRSASADKRLEALRTVTKLFLESAPHLPEHKVELFDEIIGELLGHSDTSALAELSESLAPVPNAPPKVIRRLANDAEIDVASPVLTNSPRLTTEDLVALAQTKGQGHLLAISRRASLPAAATDVLVTRGNRDVVHNVASNNSAEFSKYGLDKLFERAAQDERVAAVLSTRPDILPDVLRDSLAQAIERLESRCRSAAAAQRNVIALKQAGKLDDDALCGFAYDNRREDVIAAISVLSGLKYELTETLVDAAEPVGLVIVCRAIGVGWSPLSEILRMPKEGKAVSQETLLRLHADFGKLTRPTAERIVRFWQVRQQLGSASKN
jgi:uncharacterized protein (DUF2336 family)